MVFGKYATSNERLIGIDFMHPIPCTNCGNNFMRRDLNPDAPRLCNNCYKPKEKDMTKLRLILNIDKDVHINIEEECLNLGINYNQNIAMVAGDLEKYEKLYKDIVIDSIKTY